MKILRAYVLREHLAPFLVTLGGLTVMLLIGNILKFAELVIVKGVSIFDFVRLLLYLIPYMLSFTVPMACLVAMVFAFGRLSADYELIAMRASGVAPVRLLSPVIVVGLIISAVLLIINDRVVPETHLAFRRQLKSIGIKQPAAYIEAGTFIKEFEPFVMFVYQVQGQKLYNVRIYEPQPSGPTRTIIADRGQFERLADRSGVQLKLYDGTMDEWDAQHPGTFYKVTFTTYALALRTTQEDPERLGKKLKELTFHELADEQALLQAQGIETLPVALELHRRVAWSFAPFVFVLFGLALGVRFQQHERLAAFVWILVVFMGYYFGSLAMNAVAVRGWVGPALAMWVPNLVGAATGGLLVTRAVRR